MALGFDELIERLLYDVALSGSHGKTHCRISPSDTLLAASSSLGSIGLICVGYCADDKVGCGRSGIDQAVRAFYKDRDKRAEQNKPTEEDHLLFSDAPPAATTTVDDALLNAVWGWLIKHADIIVESPEDCAPETAGANELEPASNDVQTEATPTATSEPARERLFVSEERMWHAITGHGVDTKRVPFFEFQCLSVIAAHGPAGVLQPQVRKLTGQQKQSVPRRTDMLAQKGYITKRTVIAEATKTSLLKLKKFEMKNDAVDDGRQQDVAGKDSLGRTIIDYDRWFEHTVRSLKNQPNQVIALQDLRLGLGIHMQRLESRCLMRCIRRLARAGCVRKCSAKPTDNAGRATLHKAVRCIQLMREPTAVDKVVWGTRDRGERKRQSGLVDGELAGNASVVADEEENAESETEDDDEVEDLDMLDNRIPPQWTPDVPMPNLLFDTIDATGPEGISSMALAERVAGPFMRRPIYEQMGMLTDIGQHSQPPHLRHLSIIKDSSIRGRSVHSQYRSLSNFEKAVEDGEASWDAIQDGDARTVKGKVKAGAPTSAAASELDHWGFPKVSSTLFAGRDGRASLAEAARSAQGASGAVSAPSKEPLRKPAALLVVRANRTTPRVLKQPRIAPEKDQEEFATWAQRIAETTVRIQVRKTRSFAAKEKHDDVDEPVKKRRRLSKSASTEPAELPSEELPPERVAEVVADLLSKSLPGIYINPPGARDLKAQWYSELGRPRNALIAVVKTDHLKQLDFFMESAAVIAALPAPVPVHEEVPMVEKDTTPAPKRKRRMSTKTREAQGAQETSQVEEEANVTPEPKRQRRTSSRMQEAVAGAIETPQVEVLRLLGQDTSPDIHQPTAAVPSTPAPKPNLVGTDTQTFSREHVDSHPDEEFYHAGRGRYRRLLPSPKNPQLESQPDMAGTTLAQSAGQTQQAESLYSAPPPITPTAFQGPTRTLAVNESLTYKKDYVDAHPDETFYHVGNGRWRHGNRPAANIRRSVPALIPATPTAAVPDLTTRHESVSTPSAAIDAVVPFSPSADPAAQTSLVVPAPAADTTPAAPLVESPSEQDTTTYDTAYVKAHEDEVFHHVGRGRWRLGPRPVKQTPGLSNDQSTPAVPATASPSQASHKKLNKPTKAATKGTQRSLIVKLKVPGLQTSPQLLPRAVNFATGPTVQRSVATTIRAPTVGSAPLALAIIRPYLGKPTSEVEKKCNLPRAQLLVKLKQREAISREPETPAQTGASKHANGRYDADEVFGVEANTKTNATPATAESTHTSALTPLWSKTGGRSIRGGIGSKVSHQRTSIILDVLEQCGGVFPGKWEMLHPFATAWQNLYKETPDRRTVEKAVTDMVASGKLGKITFSFRTKKGDNATHSVLTLPAVGGDSILVDQMKEAIVDAYPAQYIPEEVVVSEEQRAKIGKCTRILPNGAVTPADPKQHTRDEFPSIQGLSVQRTKQSLELVDEEARAQGYEDARDRMKELNRKAQREWYRRKQRRRRRSGESDGEEVNGDEAAMRDESQVESYQHDLESAQSPRLDGRIGLSQIAGAEAGSMASQGVDSDHSSVGSVAVANLDRDAESFLPPVTHLPRETVPPRFRQSFHSPSGTFGTTDVWSLGIGRIGLHSHDLESRQTDRVIGSMSAAGVAGGRTMNDNLNLPTPRQPKQIKAQHSSLFGRTPKAKTRPKPETFDSAYVLSHRTEQFHHVGRGRYRRGPKPLKEIPDGTFQPEAPELSLSQLLTQSSGRAIVPKPSAFPALKPSILPAPSPEAACPLLQAQESASKPRQKYKSRKRKATEEDSVEERVEHIATTSHQSTGKRIPLTDADVQDLIIALSLVKTLCGGLGQQRLNWTIVAHALSFKFDADLLQTRWSSLARTRSRDVEAMQGRMRDSFLAAYERDELPKIDFQLLGNTEWPALFEWWKFEALLPTQTSEKDETYISLPNSMNTLWNQYAVAEPESLHRLDAETYFTGKADHVRESAALKPLHGSALEEGVTRPDSDNAPMLLKSWCRAVAATEDGQYNTEEASKKITIFSNSLIKKATNELLEEQVLATERKGRQLPGRNYYLGRSLLKQFRRWPGDDQMFLREVAAARSRIISHFESFKSFGLSKHATDPEILVLTNMVAQGQLKTKSVLPDRNDDFNAPWPKLSAWGIGDADALYNSHGYDPVRAKFPVVYEKTAWFSAQHGLKPVPIPHVPAAFEGEQGLRTPLWIDIHGNLINDLWDTVLQSLLHLIVYRTGLTANFIEKAHDGKLWLWEIHIVLGWMAQVGLAMKFGAGKENNSLWHGGWRASEWWYCAFAPDIATWQAPITEVA